MPNLMESGAAWLADQLFTHAASPIVYARGGDSVSITAVRAQTIAELNTEFGMNIDVRISDFIIQESDLVLLATKVKPERGDTITIVIDDETIVYTVLPEFGDDAYRESDRFGNTYRVHAKETGRT